MARFSGGALASLGISPQYFKSLDKAGKRNIRQLWKSSGASINGSKGQALSGGLSNSQINVVLGQSLGSLVNGSGVNISGGRNVLAQTLTPFVTGTTSAAINNQIRKALRKAGPFGDILSSAGSGLIDGFFKRITGSGGGRAAPIARGTNYKMFPGGGGEPRANYGGNTYTLGEVVFSIQAANAGPQQFGSASAVNSPKTKNKMGFKQLKKLNFNKKNQTAKKLKKSAMVNGLSKKNISKLASTFNPGLNLF
jgi:hypothetical protein